MKRTKTLAATVLALAVTAIMVPATANAEERPEAAADDNSERRGANTNSLGAAPAARTDKFNDVYFMQAHNTYDKTGGYLTALNSGLRAVEIDIIEQDDWSGVPEGPYVSHSSSPGLKSCTTPTGSNTRMGHCLKDVMDWQDANPGQGPIQVFIDLKGFTYIDNWVPWGPNDLNRLDKRIRTILGDRMYTPNDLYTYTTGNVYNYDSSPNNLRQAVSDKGWPTLAELDDKVIVYYTAGQNSFHNQTQSEGLFEILRKEKRMPHGFFCPDVETDPGEVEPNGTVAGFSNYHSQLIVCSNTQTQKHYQVTSNRVAQHKQVQHVWDGFQFGNSSYEWNHLAVAHGASVIGRDDNYTDTFDGSLPLIGKRMGVPGYFELAASVDSGMCADVEGAVAKNGTRVMMHPCHSGTNQKWVYTAEGQLRPQQNNVYCLDIKNGRAGQDAEIHTWDCDGGKSEQWALAADGTIRSNDNRDYCLTAPSVAQGTQLRTKACDGSASQKFVLKPVAPWQQPDF